MKNIFINCGRCKKLFNIGRFPIGFVVMVNQGKCPICNYISKTTFGIITPFSKKIYDISSVGEHPQIASSLVRKFLFRLSKTEEQQNILKELPKGSNPAPYNLILLATKAWLFQNGIEGGTASLKPGHSISIREESMNISQCMRLIKRSLAFWYKERDLIITKIRFDLSFAIISPDGTYFLQLPNGKSASIEIRFRPPGYHRMGVIPESTGACFPQPIDAFSLEETPEDIRVSRVQSLSGKAFLGFSSVLLTIPEFIDTFDEPELPSSLASEQLEPIDPLFIYQMPPEFRIAAEYTNHFIDHLRFASNRYEIDKLSPGDIEAVSISAWGRDFLLMHLPLRGGGPFIISTEPIAEPGWLVTLQNQLKNDNAPDLIKILILDAKKFILQEQLRLAVISVNAALEMFVNTHVFLRKQPSTKVEEIEKFMEGESIYEMCKKELIREADKGNQNYREIADLLPILEVDTNLKKKPSVNKIVNFMDDLVSFEISRKKLNKIISKIRIYRNEVAHGVINDNGIDPNKVGSAVSQLEYFIEMAVRTNNKTSIIAKNNRK